MAQVQTAVHQPTWELVLKRNSIERLKQEKFPLDIVDELPSLIARGYEAVPEEDIVRLNWWGLTHDKPKVGTFMVRIKVPGGRIRPAQLVGLGEISRRYGRNYGELTTRQGIQLHWVRLEDLPEVLSAVQATGLTTVGGEGDTVRNVTSCPVAGVDREELFDVRPVVQAVARFFYGNREYSNLPRKHKYTISACPAQCNAPEIHDVALVGVVKDGRPGFAVRVGGGLSATPRISRDLGVFVPAEPVEGVVEVLRAITDVWQSDLRYRLSRAKARIKFLVDDDGPQAVRERVEARLGRPLEDGYAPPPARDTDHMGVHPQKQEGLAYVGVPVPLGWITGDQLVALGELVDSFGGEVRFTRMQNLIVTDVPQDRVDWLTSELARLGLDPRRNPVYARSIACTDHRFCNFSVAETKGKLKDILAELEARFGEAVGELRIYTDGCPHACAHHWVGDIGLQGTTTVHPEKKVRVEAYDVCLRGGLGTRAAIGKPLLRRIPEDQITEVVCRLVEAWLREKAQRGNGYTFRDFVDAHTDEALQALAVGKAATREETPRRPVVRIPGMLLVYSGGADRVEVEARTVREALEALRAQYPQLVEHVLAPDGTVHPGVNLFVGEEDVRGLGGLDVPLRPGEELTILPALSGGAR